ncbi:WD repeat-containing protein 75 [Coccinella septempunctata]|uniref:WD repeat-containing protein 75 n=1 Tax=Coccinella septempunctata TaxID=41139 RepID=UPI001D05E41B|nr:WD repeat-containing protein 75 [Coccinella septempunctata]
MNVEKVKLKARGGGCYINLKPKFSSTEECIFIVKKQTVLQYSTKTGQLITEYQGLDKSIVGIDITHLSDCENLIAFSEDGEFRAWKTATRFKTISKKVQFNEKINSFHFVPNENLDCLEGIVTYTSSGKAMVALVNIQKESFKNFKVNLRGDDIFIGVSNRRFFAVADKKSVQFIMIDNPEKSRQVFVAEKQFKDLCITCLECHKQEEIVLTGDSEGKVILWRNIFSTNPAKSVYHWHTLPVNCLAFSSSGSYFYSGGNESVLVRWDWENSQDKKFLPRLSGYIKEIGVSSRSQLLAIFTSNNEVKIVDSNLNNISSIQHFVVGDNYESGIVLDSRTKALVMNGNIGQLQFYHPKTDSLLYSIDVVGQNKRSNERNIEIPNIVVTKFAFSKNSLWLATVEELEKSEYGYHELRLKFWAFDASRQTYELNTSIEKPHEDSITSIAFQPTNGDQELKCVTVGADKKFKIWHKIIMLKVNIERTIWNAMGNGTYLDMPCKGLSFSVDGSLMAIGFGPALTTWSPDSCQLKCSLVYPKYKTDIEKVQFGTNNLCHLIVVATKDRLSVWNILTLRMIWTVPLDVEFLFADKLSIYMGVITRNKEVAIFSPNCSKPVYISNEILSSKQIMAAAFIPTESCLDTQTDWYKRVELFFVDSNKELFSIGAESTEEYSVDQYVDDIPDEHIASLLNKMMPFKKTSHVSNGTVLQVVQKSQKNIKEYLDTPTHIAVPPRFSCLSLMKSLECRKL